MTPKTKNILFATDLSENSAYAFNYAVDLAKKNKAKIIILHAIEPVSQSAIAYLGMDWAVKVEKEHVKKDIKEVKNRVQEFCKKAQGKAGARCSDLVSKTIVLVGHPTEEILNAANKEKCDMIVLGSHGKGFLAHTFLGSVSSGVLHRSRKPVLIIPPPSEKH